MPTHMPIYLAIEGPGSAQVPHHEPAPELHSHSALNHSFTRLCELEDSN